MKTALIGYTGFVGSNLAAQYDFNDLYNSKNIQDIEGKAYDLVVSAGARAEKWRINQDPETDLKEISQLMAHLEKISTKQFILISTVDVYKMPMEVDEDTALVTEGLHPYGANRIKLEEFINRNFDNNLIVRLPGLFGKGLKKNVIFDLLHNNNVENINYAGSFQYYNLDNIWRDINVALENGVKLINFATEPILTREIASHCFGFKSSGNNPSVRAGAYDMHTKLAKAYGRTGNYLYNKEEILLDIMDFVSKGRKLAGSS